MKIKHLLIGLFAVAATVACKQDEPVETPSLEVSQESLALAATEAEASFEVTANVAWTATADQDWVSLDPASGDASKKAVAVTVTAEDNTATEARTATVTVNAGDLTKTVALTQAAAEAEDPGTDPTVPEVTELYMLGEACDTGWALDNMTAFELVDGLWVWEGNLKAGKDFRFHLVKKSGEFWPGLVPTTEGKVVYATGDNQVENPYRIETDGNYKVTVDVAAMTVTFERLSDYVQPELVIYILGGAINENADEGWKLNKMQAFESNNGIYTWTGHLRRDEFRFPLQKDWWPCYMISTDGESLVYGTSDDDKEQYRVETPGVYTITIDATDPENPTVEIELVEADPGVTDITYTVAGTISGCEWNPAGEAGLMTKEGDYYVAKNLHFLWRSTLYTDSPGQNFFQLKVCETGTWTAYCKGQGGVVEHANAAIDVTIAGENIDVHSPEGTYDVYLDKENSKVWVMKAGYAPGDEVPEDEQPEQPEITYTVTGGIDGEGNHWNNAAAIGLMTQEGEYLVAKNIPFKVRGDLYDDSPGQNWFEFKICQTGTWDAYAKTQKGVMDKANVAVDVVAMSGENINVQAPSGNYDVYFDKANSKVWVMTTGYKPGDEVPEDEQPEPQNPDYQVSELYMLGGACETGWDLSMMVPFTKEGDVWVWEGNLNTSDAFRFPLQKQPNVWWPCLVPNADGTAVVLQTDDPNSSYRIESNGYYKVTVTPLTGALAIERLGDNRAPSFIRELYVIGTGAKVQGWNVPITNPEAKFTNNGDGTFTWVGELVADEEFRFNTQPFDWGPSLSYVEDGKLMYPGDKNMKVAEGGIYTIVVDVTDYNNITYTLTKHEEPKPEPVLTLATNEASVAADATSYEVALTANCAWEAVATDGVTVTPATGEGDATVTLTFAANEVTSPVTHSVTFSAGEGLTAVLTLTQAAAEPKGPKVVTVAEFNNAPNDESIEYQVSGTISGIYSAYNAQYDNISLYISDETGEMLAYRLSCKGIEDPANTLTEGDIITVQGYRTLYNEKPQMAAGCAIVSHTDVVVDEPEVPETAVVWTLGSGNQTWGADTHTTYGAGYAATVDGIKVAYYKNKNNNAARTPDSDHIRVYQDAALVITAEGKTIKSVEIEVTASDYAKAIKVGDTTVQPDGKKITWTGDLASFEAIPTAQIRIKKLTIVAE